MSPKFIFLLALLTITGLFAWRLRQESSLSGQVGSGVWHQTSLHKSLAHPLPEIPKDYFAPPVANVLQLSGTFGELRPNHFHEGIDIKPLRAAGEPIYAAADGFVARVRTLPRGFGNVLYLNHPNGFTTVYAHLQRFADPIQAYIRSAQYTARLFELDLSPGEVLFPVKKGDLIGFMGNTGSSTGAHLHFEIRETLTDAPINPLLFGLYVSDSQAPEVKAVKIYALDQNGRELKSTLVALTKKNGEFVPAKSPVVVNADYIGLAVHANDVTDEIDNRLGIYGIELFADGQPAFSFVFDQIAYEETRYLNAHIDYKEGRNGRRVHRCFRLPGNRLGIYKSNAQNGVLPLSEASTTELLALVKDINGNTSTIRLLVQKGTELPPPGDEKSFQYLLAHDDTLRIKNGEVDIYFPPGSVYENTPLSYRQTVSGGVQSLVHQLGSSETPVHEWFDVGIKPLPQLSDSLRDKAVVVVNGGKNLGGQWRGGWLWAQSQQLGSFSIVLDLDPPAIALIGKYKGTPTASQQLSFKITDNLTEVAKYHAFVDGEWMLLVYDKKSSSFTMPFEGRIAPGEHQIRVEATDGVGNRAEWSGSFIALEK